jgi:hypothetical protein
MVHIKFTARPRPPIVLPKFAPVAWDDAIGVSTEQRESLAKQPKESLVGQQMVASTEVALEQDAESDQESQSSDSKTASNNCERMKVGAAIALAGISYHFGLSTIMKTRLGSLESYTHYFPKGYGRPPGAEFVLDPQTNEAVVFKDFFTAGLCMPPHPVLVDILCKFRIQLHQLTPNAVTSPRLNRINSILIPLSCNFFFGSPPAKNSGVKRAWPGAISGWVTDREVFPGTQSEDKSAWKRLGLVCRARL